MTGAPGDGLGVASAAELRRLVREVLAEVLPATGTATARPPAGPGRPPQTVAAAGAVPSGVPAGRPAAPGRDGPPPAPAGPGATGSAAPAGPPGCCEVRIGSDEDLREFALRVLKLAGNPRQRSDLLAGRIRFRLAASREQPGSRAVHRVDKGAVTERTVSAAAAAGARLVLGPRAVLTPLGKDKARALGVPVDKER
jgi:hypothetical protein